MLAIVVALLAFQCVTAAPARLAPLRGPPLQLAALDAAANKTRVAIVKAQQDGVELAGTNDLQRRFAPTPCKRQASGAPTPSGPLTNTAPPVPTPTQTGRIQLAYDPNMAAWTGPLQVGTPGQTERVIWDTGSSDLWVTSSSCTSQFCSGKAKYNPALSSTAQTSTQRVSIAYQSGEDAGVLANDVVGAAGLSVVNYSFVAADTLDAQTQQEPEDGIVGLGWAASSANGLTPWFDSLMSGGTLLSGVFSFFLSTSGGELTLGGTNPARYTGDIEWHANPSPAIWYSLTASARLSGQEFASGFIAGFDTGTSYILADPQAVASFYASVPGATPFGDGSWYLYECASPPSLSFAFDGGREWAVSPEAFNAGELGDGVHCFGALVAYGLQEQGFPVWILGGSFLSNAYSVFDKAGSRIGFAQLA